ncbi:hypothetical protein [Actinocrispum wychmicini]|uniref:hypothetical protein n=1 Tax=Actinocrispum wychmicini TaxID=1213861 RepID=UPI0010510AA8|nr:hypothetical protein [Actinocrispum wychmicini]
MTYEEALAAVRERIARYTSASDPEDVLDPAGLRDVEFLLATPTPEGIHAAGVLHYARHLAAEGGEADLATAKSLLDKVNAPGLPGQLSDLNEAASRPVRLTPGQVAAFTFGGSPLPEVDGAIVMIRHHLRAEPDDAQSLMNLAEAQRLRFLRTGNVADLDASVATLTRVPDSDERSSFLGGLLQLRFGVTSDPADLNASIEALQEAVDITGDDPMFLANLGRARLIRYVYLRQDDADLDTAVRLLVEGVAATSPDDPSRAARLGSLVQARHTRFDRDGDRADLDQALLAGVESVRASSRDDPELPERMLGLGAVHLSRFQVTRAKDDLKQAVDLAKKVRRALPKDHPLRALANEILGHAR